jgi:hypothetical protein
MILQLQFYGCSIDSNRKQQECSPLSSATNISCILYHRPSKKSTNMQISLIYTIHLFLPPIIPLETTAIVQLYDGGSYVI